MSAPKPDWQIWSERATKAAGHLLDGKEHHEFPNAASAATPDQKPKEEA